MSHPGTVLRFHICKLTVPDRHPLMEMLLFSCYCCFIDDDTEAKAVSVGVQGHPALNPYTVPNHSAALP